MINPGDTWMTKHGYTMWGVEETRTHYIHHFENLGILGDKEKHVVVKLDKREYRKLTKDSQKRAMLYRAAEAEEKAQGE